MNDAYIHFIFPEPGQWDKFTMAAVYRDAAGYIRTDLYTPDTLPADRAPALADVVTALVGMGEPWQASQGWAYLDQVRGSAPGDTIPAIILDVEAVNAQGGRRMFTAVDYPAFIIPSPSAVEFFRHFTSGQLNS
ncbi:MAG: hypothetical protein KHX31_09985 [Akkermansia sp.]|uniref:hypothetical protein n=1 Tax=Akkermansia sp. TaxID=1872421 RepID=UPI0025BC7A46|nr:hypothetical protein [Akkermansia sp.]MBS5508951.1 hypothetical protein [Akkermansia sp.]